MMIRNTLKAAALAGVCLAPLAAAAQDAGAGQQAATDQSATYNNEIDLGLRGQTQTNPYYGRYNGYYNKGVDFTGGFSLRSPQDWKSNDTYYWRLTAKDLDFGPGDNFDIAPEASVNLRVGNQGSWGLTAAYDAITYIGNGNFTSIYDRSGNRLGGVPAVVAGTTTDTLAPYAQQQIIGTRRDRATVGLNGIFGNWIITAQEMHEHKDGTMEQTGLTTAGNNGGFAAFPMPINYDTDRFDLSADYNTARSQTKFLYTFSNFTDNNGAFNYAPYKYVAGEAGGGPSGFYSLPPSNMAHAISVNTGYNLSEATRLNGMFQYGVQLQNDGFAPATGVTGAMSSTLQNQLASNPSSLDGFINTVFGKVSLTSRPAPGADLNISYTIDGRYADNSGKWMYGDPSDSNAADKFRYAVEPSWTKQKGSIEFGYKVLSATKVSLGYDYSRSDRTEAVTASTNENKVTAKVRTQFNPDLMGNLEYSYLDRTASAPDFTIWQTFMASDCNTTAGLAGLWSGANCRQVPFYENSAQQHSVKGRLTDILSQDTTMSLIGKFDDTHYGDSPSLFETTYNSRSKTFGTADITGSGMTHQYNAMVGPDFTHRFSKDGDSDLFYTFQRTYRSMTADNFGAEATTGDTHTAGASTNWKLNDKLKVGASYTFSYGSEAFAQSGFNPLADAVLPMVTSMDNSLSLHGEYEVMPGVSLYLGYSFDRLIMSDWTMWGTSPSAGGAGAQGLQLTSGDMNPNYNVHTILTQVSFKW